MRNLISSILFSGLLLSGCSSDESEKSFEEKILGNWQVVIDNNYQPAVVEWGIFYVGTVKLYNDNSFKLNLSDQIDDESSLKHGTWQLSDDKKSITFYTSVSDGLTLQTNTTEFKISLMNEKLILENDFITIYHKHLNN